MTETLKKELDTFFNGDGKAIDAVFSTSDEKLFLDHGEAVVHSLSLTDKAVSVHYREGEGAIRNIEDALLQKMVILVDWLKKYKYKKLPAPTYTVYAETCKHYGNEPAPETSFNFAVTNVFKEREKMIPFETEELILDHEGQITKGRLLRSYGQAKMYLTKDRVIMTCPTNIELMAHNVTELFAPLFL